MPEKASAGYLEEVKRKRISPVAAVLIAGCAVAPHEEIRDDRPVIALRVRSDDTSAYDREQWMPGGRWNRSDSGCLDTRARVLIQESIRSVRLRPSGCTVDSGVWVSAYSGDTIYAAAELEIDHVVPLAEAHRSGGAAWDSARKNAYANDISFPDHLVAVDASSNASKRDRDPAHWVPLLRSSKCLYLERWVRVKAIWDLTVDSTEFLSIQRGLDSCASVGVADASILRSR